MTAARCSSSAVLSRSASVSRRASSASISDALALGDLLEPLAELPLCTIEILVPGREPLLDLALHLGECLGEPVTQPLLRSRSSAVRLVSARRRSSSA